MKAILTFEADFSIQEERQELLSKLNCEGYKSILWDVDQHLRNRIKHEDLSDDVCTALEKVREMIHSGLAESSLSFD